MPAIRQLAQKYSSPLRTLNCVRAEDPDTLSKTFDLFVSEVALLSGVEGEIAAGLKTLLTDRDFYRISLWITAAGVRPLAVYVPGFCSLLSVRDAYLQHEWIVHILREIHRPESIDALRDACSYDLSSDPYRQLALLRLEAQATIATPNAIEAIRSQCSSPWTEVRNEATRLLQAAA